MTACVVAGYWEDPSDRKCKVCASACTACEGSASTCSDCVQGAQNYFLIEANNECSLTCPVNMWRNPTTRKCTLCTGCATCLDTNSGEDCLSCTGTTYLRIDTKKCVPKLGCPFGTYGEDSNHQCMGCNVACTSCFLGTSTKCYTCNSGNFYNTDTTTCSQECPPGYYKKSGTFTCEPCTACKTCDAGPTDCSSCNVNTYLEGRTCIATCAKGTYGNPTTNICTTCSVACTDCFG